MADPVTMTMLSIGSTVLSAVGKYQEGRSQQKLMNYRAQQAENIAKSQAAQLEYKAGQERAAAQQRMIESGRQKRVALSRAQALAASGGGGSLDPSVINLLGELEAQGEYNKGTAFYEGEEAAKSAEYDAAITRSQGKSQAAVDRFSGKMYKQAGTIEAVSTLMKGASNTLMDKYGETGKINWNDGTTSTYRKNKW